MSFGYKSLNALIQGSGADQAKQAMIDFAKRTKHARLLLSLHDEIIISCKEGHEAEEGELLMDCMINAFQLDVPFVSDVKIGANFSEVK
jgi:DNA polymerase-1